MGLREYAAKRIVYTIVLVFLVITIDFVIFMAGDPMRTLAGTRRLKDPRQIEEQMRRFGLLDPIYVRYGKYVQNLLTFQFGYSFRTGEPIFDEMGGRLASTLVLCLTAEVIAVLIGLVLGVLASYRRGGATDMTLSSLSIVTNGLPVFWIGMVLVFIFSSTLGWFPSGHSFPPEWAIPGRAPANFLLQLPTRLWYLCLPALTLVVLSVGGYILLTRASMLEVLSEDYLTTLKAKGLSERKILFKHALKNASLPILTQTAIAFGFTLSGAIVTETIFTYPGLGMWTWDSIVAWDYPALQAIFYVVSLCVILANFFVDMIYGVIDPRIRY
jgi:peptide/nickel transport system permease protein